VPVEAAPAQRAALEVSSRASRRVRRPAALVRLVQAWLFPP